MLKLWLMAGILAGLAIFTAGTWRMASSVRFSRESTVLRGTFLAYVENRVGGASDEKRFFRNSYPRFEFEMADGTRREVVGAENHLFRVFRGGDRVEVLVHPDGRERIRAFVPLYAHAVNLLLLGGLLFVMALGGLRSVQSWDRAVSGGDPAVQVPGPEARAPSGWSIGPVAFGILLLVAGGTVGVNLVLSRSRVAPPERTSPEGLDRAGGGPDPERLDRSNRGPEPATAEPDVDLSGPADGAEPPAPPSLHAAAREGDVEALASLLDAGRSVEDLEPAMVMHLVRRDDTGAIRVLLEHGLDPAGEYGGRTIGDHAVAAGSAEVVKLIQDHGGRFDAPPAFVALAAGDREALTAALPQADPSAQFTGSTLPWFARHIGREDLLRESAPDRALPPRQEPRGGHLSAAHAARAGDHAALREFIEDGADIADINPANLMAPISEGKVETLRLLFEHGYPWDSYAGSTLGDHAVQYGQTEIVLLAQEYGREFRAPPEFVALVAGDENALRAALKEAGSGRQFLGRDIAYWAETHGRQALLAAARSAP